MRRRWVVILVLVLVSLGAGGTNALVARVDQQMNGLTPSAVPVVSADAAALHRRLLIADLHADSLLWGRDLRKRHERGHLDLPRMVEGNLFLQVFGVVTSASSGDNYTANSGKGDQIGQLMLAQGHVSAVGDLAQRARVQAQDLHKLAARSDLQLLRTGADVAALRAAREAGQPVMGAVLSLEGAHGLGPEAAYLDAAFADGYRVVGLAHFFDNEFAGSLHGTTKHGLTDAGRALVQRLDALGVIIDLAHASPTVVEEVLALSPRPPVVSHTGIHSACQSPRNLSDARMKRIAAAGGLIGVGFWEGAICDTSPAGIARHLLAAVALVGVDHVSLGSDWDGTIHTTVDAARLPQITQALLDAGAAEETIAAVMGGNLVRFLEENLPP